MRLFTIYCIIAAGMITMLLYSCKKRNLDDIKGPSIIAAPDGFEVLSFSVSNHNPDFAQEDTANFNASFSDPVSWILTIEGQASGAKKEYRSVGDGITGSKARWQGRHDEAHFFRAGEKAVATLSFFGTSTTWSDTLTIEGTRNYKSYGFFPEGADFEDPDAISYPEWAAFDQESAEQGVGRTQRTLDGKLVTAVQGERYYYMRDQPLKDAQFIDGIRIDSLESSNFPSIPSNPEEVWVNIYVYGTGNDNVQFNFEFHEADADDPEPGHQQPSDDSYIANISGDHTGWQLFSFKYSNLSASGAAEYGGSGNGVHEPHRIERIQFGLLKSNDNSERVEVFFDFPIITIGGPFDPTQ